MRSNFPMSPQNKTKANKFDPINCHSPQGHHQGWDLRLRLGPVFFLLFMPYQSNPIQFRTKEVVDRRACALLANKIQFNVGIKNRNFICQIDNGHIFHSGCTLTVTSPFFNAFERVFVISPWCCVCVWWTSSRRRRCPRWLSGGIGVPCHRVKGHHNVNGWQVGRTSPL